MEMKIKSVRGRVEPKYPTREYLTDHPELLAIVPERWRRNPLVLRVLGGVVGLMLASQQATSGQNSAPNTPVRPRPLSPRGPMRGTFGCVAVNPPVYLSEDEARQVIQEEARKVGLEFSVDAAKARGAAVPVVDRYWCLRAEGLTGKQVRGVPTQKHALALDGFDQQHNVAFEFVSWQDYNAFVKKDPGCGLPSGTPATGEAPHNGIQASDATPWVGVFYDGGARPSNNEQIQREGRVKAGQQLGAEDLRKQVRDFLLWLKAQGVI